MDESFVKEVQWLVDRALISDLLYSFANTLDSKDLTGYIDNFTEDGILKLPDPKSTSGEYISIHHHEISDFVGNGIMKAYSATHHISSNHQIRITGDTASSKSYLQAVHVRATPDDHWGGGGWYDCTYVKTSNGWKFHRVTLTAVWLAGNPQSISPE